MHGLNLIKEEIFRIASKKWAKDYFKKFWPDEMLDNDQYAYCIYTVPKKKVEIVHFEWGGSVIEKPTFSDAFARYLKRNKPKKFKEYIFFLDMYTMTRRLSINLGDHSALYLNEDIEEAIKSFHRYRSKTAEAIEALLEETKGFIIWQNQLESILNIFVDNHDEALSLRKGFNAKQPNALKVFDGFYVDKKTTLTEFIRNRLLWISGCTVKSNIHGAFVLYKVLNSSGSNNNEDSPIN